MSDSLKKKKGTRTATRDARREQLIHATIDSISKRGFSGTTLTTVTKTARLSHGIVNFHFDSKEQMYVETLGYLAREHYDRWHGSMLAAGDDPALQLRAILRTDFEPDICSPKKLAVWFAFWGQAKYRPNYLEVHHKYDDERSTEILRLCTEIAHAGQYEGVDPESVMRSLAAMVDGLWLMLLMYPNEVTPQAAFQDCLVFLERTFPRHFPNHKA